MSRPVRFRASGGTWTEVLVCGAIGAAVVFVLSAIVLVFA